MYVEEHPNSSESPIYAVRGPWVLCSNGRRRVMDPGLLFRFVGKTPAGYQVPSVDVGFACTNLQWDNAPRRLALERGTARPS